MGRKPLKKHRKKDEKLTEQWLVRILPVFQQEGFEQFTMDQVVKIAGVSKATFYKYYSSREKLIDAIIQSILNNISQFQDQLFDSSLNYYDRYFNAIQVTTRAMSGISIRFLEDLRAAYPEKWKAIDEFRTFAVGLLENFYREGVEQGYLVKMNPKLIALTDHIFFSQMTDPAFLAKNGLTLHEAFAGYMTLKNEGIILHKKGVDVINKRMNELESPIS